MLTAKCNPGDVIVCTKDISGITQINKGDRARCLGHSQVRILTGPSKDWLCTLTVMAPFTDEVIPA